jgi:hypothetical protein
MKPKKVTTLLQDLVFRTQQCGKFGGSVNDGTAKDGYHDYRSLQIVVEQVRSRMAQLAVFEKFNGGPIEPDCAEEVKELNECRAAVVAAEKVLQVGGKSR